MTPRTPGTAPTTARVRAFFAAIQPGNGEAIRRRLRLGMPVDITQDGEGYTPLHVAALRAADDVVAVLLECGATVDAMTARGDSVLNSAAYAGHAGLMKLLLDAGASVHGMPGVRALASSIRRKHHDAARLLIAAGVDLNTPDDVLMGSALEQAIRLGAPIDFLAEMVRAGADVNGAGFSRPLCQAIANAHLDVFELLLAAGADVNQVNEYGDTALMMAASYGNVSAVNRLMDLGVSVDSRESRVGRTALMNAVWEGRFEVVELLLQRGADPFVIDFDGKNLLTYAQISGEESVISRARDMGLSEQPEFREAIEAAERLREEERAEKLAEASAANGERRRGKVTAGPFVNFTGTAYIDESGKIVAQLEVFGRSTQVTLDASEFLFDEALC